MNNNSVDICDELHQNFIDFAYEANSQRAFPDARDGLKPGQRACLWEMYSKGYSSNKPHVKSAKISGGTIATWWPHGDVAIYETFARMSQPWINNIPEVDWHGSNGNVVIGSAPASSRYTEARLSKAAEDGLLQGLKKKNTNMILNFSEDEEWPEVFPAIMPRLLINGSQGIGVTIANTWLNYNLREVSAAIINYIQTGIFDNNAIYPDFPSGGIIINKNKSSEINATGKGTIIVRAKTEIKDNSIIITELPYQVYVEPVLDTIKGLVENETIKGIKDIYNKSDKKRLLIEIELEKNSDAKHILNSLFQNTELQKSYSANQWALVGKTPKLLNLKDYFDIYIEHNIKCIKAEYEFDLNKAKDRIEIVDGLLKALEDIDNIIALIKSSESAAVAKIALEEKYSMTERQAQAILDMKLSKLAHLEKIELEKENSELVSNIEQWTAIITNKDNLKSILVERLTDFTNKYGEARRTELTQIEAPKGEDKEVANVEPEKCVVIMSEDGSIKRIPVVNFRTQKRNGKGVKTTGDITAAAIRTNTIDSLMIFTNKGRMYRILVNDIPIGNNSTKGTPISSLIEMENNEKPTLIYSIYRDTNAKYVLFMTKNGIIKKTLLDEYIATKKKSGLTAINLRDGDSLASVNLISDEDIIILTSKGNAIRIKSSDVTASSRATIGVKGITLAENDYVISALPIRNENDKLAVFSNTGMGKKINLSEFPVQKKGGKGLIVYKEEISGGALVSNEDNILIVGTANSICISAVDIPILGRTAVGSVMIKGNIVSITKV